MSDRRGPVPSSIPRSSRHRTSSGTAVAACRVLALALAGLAVACTDREPAELSREEFVNAYFRMVRARIDAQGDSAVYAAARDRALAEAGVTAREMRDFVEASREHPEEMRAAWQAIAAKLDTLYGGVTTEPPPEMREALGDVLGDTLP